MRSILNQYSGEFRRKILKTIKHSGKGHIGGAFSCVDLLIALYLGNILRIDSSNPNSINRDRFILSKAHSAIALYVVLSKMGFFNETELEKFNQGGLLSEHPDINIPGIETNGGSLGHGLGIGVGIAIAAKMDKTNSQIVVLLGDGECYEGSIWEAAMLGSHHSLDNLTVIIDRNELCILDFTEKINKLEPFSEKWKAFGWEVREIDGHNFSDIFDSFKDFRQRKHKPLLIIAHTTKGNGVSFMEKNKYWHHGTITDEEFTQASKELLSNYGN